MLTRRTLIAAACALPFVRPARADAGPLLVAAARAQIGVTTIYDPAYAQLRCRRASTLISPALNIDSARSRWFWLLLPW